MELDNLEVIKKLVEAGLGLSFMSKYTVAYELQLGTLVEVNVSEDTGLKFQFGLIYKKGLRLNSVTKSYIDHVVQFLSPPSDQNPTNSSSNLKVPLTQAV